MPDPETRALDELFAQAQSGDRDALEGLVVAHIPRVRAFLRARMSTDLRARESCSDLVQTVCLRALRGLDQFEFRSAPEFRAWLFCTARNRLNQRERDLHAERRDPAREVGSTALDEVALAASYGWATPSREASAREVIASIERALDQLTPDQREAIALCRFARLSSAEAGRIMERSDAAVRQLLGRGLYRLTKLLGADFTDRGDMD